MKGVPDAVFVIDTRREAIAVAEARKLRIPVIGIVDTNCDPDEVDVPIPGNDDALRAIRLFAGRIADAILTGRGLREAQLGRDRRASADAAAKAERRPRRRSRVGLITLPGPTDGPADFRPRGRTSPPGLFMLSRIEHEGTGFMSISAEMVRKLREETGAGMMDCKNALVEAKGDTESAREILRKKGLAAAAKKASRTASEGVVGSYIHPGGQDRRPRRGELRDRLRGQDRRTSRPWSRTSRCTWPPRPRPPRSS